MGDWSKLLSPPTRPIPLPAALARLTKMGGIIYDDDDTLSKPDSGTVDLVQLSQEELGHTTLEVLGVVDDWYVIHYL